MPSNPQAEPPGYRELVCLRCGRVFAQARLDPDDWPRIPCRCGYGTSLYERIATREGFRPGNMVGDGSNPGLDAERRRPHHC